MCTHAACLARISCNDWRFWALVSDTSYLRKAVHVTVAEEYHSKPLDSKESAAKISIVDGRISLKNNHLSLLSHISTHIND